MECHKDVAYLDSFMRLPVCWSQDKRAKALELSEDERTISCSQSPGQFKTVLGDTPLVRGARYFFEIKIEGGSTFKIGVARREANVETGFSDSPLGWAFFSQGQLRHNNGGDGPLYGKPFKQGDTVGVYVDLIEGRLLFAKNGEVFPVAYTSKDFVLHDLYPACSVLQKGDKIEML